MKKGIPAVFSLVLFFGMCIQAHAANLYMDPNNAVLKRGDTLTVSIRLDAGTDECVNAIDAVIHYSDNILPVDVSRGNSIISLWVQEPVINKANHTITFAGGIPNGYCGRIAGDPMLTNNLVDLQFQSPGLQIGATASGNEASIDFDPSTHVYLNDGFGTIASTSLSGSKIELTKEAGGSIQSQWNDTVSNDKIPPEKFSIDLERTTNAYSNRYFIVFNTTDKQTGIDHYEVMEDPLSTKNFFGWGAANAPWLTAKSPYVLDDQSLNSTIRVKAIDKAGNETIAVLVPDMSKRTLSMDNIVIIAGVVVAALVLFGSMGVIWFAVRRRSKQRMVHKSDEEIE